MGSGEGHTNMHMKEDALNLIQHSIHQRTMTREVLHMRPKLALEIVTYPVH